MHNRILTIQDISCIGQCSLTVALPIISACGIETAILPSAVLSTHTAKGFDGYTFLDLTDEMPKICSHWNTLGLGFDAVYTGYLGSIRQIDTVLDIFKNANAVKIVDPVMADNGKLYAGFDGDFVKSMRSLCAEADVIIPNITEACLLSDMPYRESYDRDYIAELLKKLREFFSGTVVLTGISFDSTSTGVIISDKGRTEYYSHSKISRTYHGTGDIYASTFTGALMRGKDAFDAAKIAADFVVECIEETEKDESHWYGVRFERAIPKLISLLGGE